MAKYLETTEQEDAPAWVCTEALLVSVLFGNTSVDGVSAVWGGRSWGMHWTVSRSDITPWGTWVHPVSQLSASHKCLDQRVPQCCERRASAWPLSGRLVYLGVTLLQAKA